MSGNIKCPVHGEHANSDQGRCWYCVKGGLVSPNVSTSQVAHVAHPTGNRVVLAYKGEK